MVLKKISAILLAVLILSSNLSIALSTHFCGGKAVKSEISIGNYDIDCGMTDMENCEVFHWDFNEIKTVPCCENQHTFFKISDRYHSLGALEFIFMPLAFVKVYSQDLFSVTHIFPKALFKAYKPPLPKQATSVLFQVFRL